MDGESIGVGGEARDGMERGRLGELLRKGVVSDWSWVWGKGVKGMDVERVGV